MENSMTPEKPNTSSAVEKTPSSETSLDTSKISLIQSFKKLHREQLEIFEETLSTLEETCLIEIKETLEKQVKKQMEDNFKNVREACQNNIVSLLSPLLKQAENDARCLNNEVARTSNLCKKIAFNYEVRWSHPLLSLSLSTAFMGSFIFLLFLFLQTSTLGVFLMNQQNREIYQVGLHYLAWQEKDWVASDVEQALKKSVPEQKAATLPKNLRNPPKKGRKRRNLQSKRAALSFSTNLLMMVVMNLP